VERIESGEFTTPDTEAMLRRWLEPMMARNIDALVLGCTHYPIIRPLIERIVGPDVRVIDPAPFIARQVDRLLDQRDQAAGPDASNGTTVWTSGDPSLFLAMMGRMGWPPTEVRSATWNEGVLTPA